MVRCFEVKDKMKKIKVYRLISLTRYYSSFGQKKYDELKDSIKIQSVNQKWENFDLNNFKVPEFELYSSDKGKKNYSFDISSSEMPFYIISEKAMEALKDILESRGQFLPIITPSKRKKFVGYYPTKPLIDGIDLEKSEQMSEDPMKNFGVTNISKLYIKKGVVLDEYIICPELGKSCVLVTEKFRQRVEEAGLEGFDFNNLSYEITLL